MKTKSFWECKPLLITGKEFNLFLRSRLSTLHRFVYFQSTRGSHECNYWLNKWDFAARGTFSGEWPHVFCCCFFKSPNSKIKLLCFSGGNSRKAWKLFVINCHNCLGFCISWLITSSRGFVMKLSLISEFRLHTLFNFPERATLVWILHNVHSLVQSLEIPRSIDSLLQAAFQEREDSLFW